MSAFTPSYAVLSEENPEWGRIALLPWDTEIFGFAVADYACQPDAWPILLNAQEAVCQALNDWASARLVELIVCHIPAKNFHIAAILPLFGFTVVDHNVRVFLNRLQSAKLPIPRLTVRLAMIEDEVDVERIAATAFHFGRYHADVRFPVSLANLRYQRWMQNAFQSPFPETQIYILGAPGIVRGFMHVGVKEQVAELHLGAVDVGLEAGILGYNLYLGVITALRDSGIQQISAKISLGNTGIFNLYIGLGFQIANPELILHWHLPNAPHLYSWDALSAQMKSDRQRSDQQE